MTAVTDIVVPDIGDFAEVPVVGVHVAPGTRVTKGDPLIELESDKAVMEVPSPTDGTVVSVLVKMGDRLSMGARIVTLAASTPTSASDDAPAPSTPAAAPQPQAAPAPTSTPAAPAATALTASPDANVYAGPGVRKLARELGLDLAAIRPSGAHGRLVREDLLRFVQERFRNPGAASAPAARAASTPPAGLQDLPPWPEPDYAKLGRVEMTELTRLQKISGANLARNWLTIPHVTNFDKADVTDTEAFREKLNAEPRDEKVKVTMLAFMMKAAVSALKAYPRFNVSFSRGGVVQKHYYNIGFAADTPEGLVVAVIADCDKKGLLEIATEARALAAKARTGKLSPREMSGGCFTVSSLGGIGGTNFTPIINAPEVAILGVSKSDTKPVWNGEKFKPRLILPLSLSYDHRVIDGAAAARFTAYLAQLLGDLRRAML